MSGIFKPIKFYSLVEMKNFITLFVLIIVLVFESKAVASEMSYGQCFYNYSHSQFNTNQMFNCLERADRIFEKKRIDLRNKAAAFFERKKGGEGRIKEKFIHIDKDWFAYRDIVCDLSEDGEPGSGNDIAKYECKMNFDIERMKKYRVLMSLDYTDFSVKKFCGKSRNVDDSLVVFCGYPISDNYLEKYFLNLKNTVSEHDKSVYLHCCWLLSDLDYLQKNKKYFEEECRFVSKIFLGKQQKFYENCLMKARFLIGKDYQYI